MAVGQLRRGGEIDPEADDDPVAAALEQDARELLAGEHQIVGPFEHQRLRRAPRTSTASISARPAASDRVCGGRIVRPQPDQGAAEEIALRRHPFRPCRPLPASCCQRDQPVAFDRVWIGKQVGIGRAGALDDPDAAQNSDPAARSVSAPSGPISR